MKCAESSLQNRTEGETALGGGRERGERSILEMITCAIRTLEKARMYKQVCAGPKARGTGLGSHIRRTCTYNGIDEALPLHAHRDCAIIMTT